MCTRACPPLATLVTCLLPQAQLAACSGIQSKMLRVLGLLTVSRNPDMCQRKEVGGGCWKILGDEREGSHSFNSVSVAGRSAW